MFYHLYISPNWLISPRARRTYLICAVLAASSWLGVWITASVAAALAGSSIKASAALYALLVTLMFPGIVAAGILWVAMWYFWFRFDPVDSFRKVLCLFFLFVLGPLGGILYYSFIYRRIAPSSMHSVQSAPAAPLLN